MTNRKKGVASNLSVPTLVGVIMLSVCLTGAGVAYAYLKNCQLEIRREIAQVERRIKQHEYDVDTRKMRRDEMLNRFRIKARLEENKTDLVRIPRWAIEEIGGNSPNESNKFVRMSVP